MKLIIATMLVISSVALAQPEPSDLLQGTSLDGREMSLPEFCKSHRKVDKKKCETWMSEQKNHKVDNSAAQQGIAIVEMMEKEQEAQQIPSFCMSSKMADRKKCDAWVSANKRFVESNPDFHRYPQDGMMPEELWQKIQAQKKRCQEKNLSEAEQKACAKFKATQTGPADYKSMVDAYRKGCEEGKHSEEEKQQCRDYAKYLSHNMFDEDERLLGCTMSHDSKEITCGDKIYVLSGSVSNMSRVNSKLDIQGSSKSQKGKSTGPKANKE